MSGGETTIVNATSGSFSFPAPNLDDATLSKHVDGDAGFEALFVAGGPINAGLGPIYNNTSCRGCHVQDGRGAPPGPGEPLSSMLIRLSLPGDQPGSAPSGIPGFGGQLQTKSLRWLKPEALVNITYSPINGTYGDGTQYTLQKPEYHLTDNYKPLPAGYLTSPRVAPIVFGLGLLEAITDADLMKNADPDDANHDGISGRVNMVYNVQTKGLSVGRFGLKANTPTLLQQCAGAYNQDMGITTPVFPDESSLGQDQYPGKSDNVEVDMTTLKAVTTYTQTLGVPARRNVNDATIREGQKIFSDAKCASCHIPTMKTGTHEIAALSNQTIHPYTDLLLHDLGNDLSDERPDFVATGNEWRTAPLWGIGLTGLASGHTFFLHDGRARNITEAILWHGGEGAAARDYFKNLAIDKRAALLKFLESL